MLVKLIMLFYEYSILMNTFYWLLIVQLNIFKKKGEDCGGIDNEYVRSMTFVMTF